MMGIIITCYTASGTNSPSVFFSASEGHQICTESSSALRIGISEKWQHITSLLHQLHKIPPLHTRSTGMAKLCLDVRDSFSSNMTAWCDALSCFPGKYLLCEKKVTEQDKGREILSHQKPKGRSVQNKRSKWWYRHYRGYLNINYDSQKVIRFLFSFCQSF